MEETESLCAIELKKNKAFVTTQPLVNRNRSVKKNKSVWKINLIDCKNSPYKDKPIDDNSEKFDWKIFVLKHFDLKTNDRRGSLVSVYLVLILLFVSASKNFFYLSPTDPSYNNTALGLEVTSVLLARLYGIVLVFGVICFVLIYVGFSSKLADMVFDVFLLICMLLTSLALIGWIYYATDLSNPNNHISTIETNIISFLIALSVVIGICLFLFYLIAFSLRDKR